MLNDCEVILFTLFLTKMKTNQTKLTLLPHQPTSMALTQGTNHIQGMGPIQGMAPIRGMALTQGTNHTRDMGPIPDMELTQGEVLEMCF